MNIRLLLLLGGACWLLPFRTPAHTGSTAYWQATVEGGAITLRTDYALRDLDDAYGLDGNDDGRITWAEVQQAAVDLQRTALASVRIEADGQACPLAVADSVAIADHGDGPYAVFQFAANCPAEPRTLRFGDTWLFGFDANHRALLSVRRAEGVSSGVLSPEQPTLDFAPAPSARRSLLLYGKEGLHHVWSGWDHMLFLAGLFLAAALRRERGRWVPVATLGAALWPAVRLVTAFTIAHAITLCLAALGVISPPSRWVESLVAFSVFFAGFNNLWPLAGPRWLFALAWGFGLIHGAAVASALQELGLPATGRVAALLGFNLGVEAAQLSLVATIVPLAVALRHWRGYRACVLWPGSAAVALAGLIWFLNRAFALHWPLPIS